MMHVNENPPWHNAVGETSASFGCHHTNIFPEIACLLALGTVSNQISLNNLTKAVCCVQARSDSMTRQLSPLPTSDAIISLGGQVQPEVWPAQGETDALSLSAGLNLSGPRFNPGLAHAGQGSAPDLQQSAQVEGPIELDPDSTGMAIPDGTTLPGGPQRSADGQAVVAKPIGRPMGRPASMQPAALIRAAREKAAAAAAAAAAAMAAPSPAVAAAITISSDDQQQVQQLQQAAAEAPTDKLQQLTPFGHPSQQNAAAAAAAPDPPAASDVLATPVEDHSAPQHSGSSVPAQEHSGGIQLAGGGDSEGISLTGLPAPPLSLPSRPTSLPDKPGGDAPDSAMDVGAPGRQGQAKPGEVENPSVLVSSVKAGSQGLEPGASVPGPAPPAGSPGGSNAGPPRRVPGPRPPPGAPPPRPPPSGQSLGFFL